LITFPAVAIAVKWSLAPGTQRQRTIFCSCFYFTVHVDETFGEEERRGEPCIYTVAGGIGE
jgi:hypothetical protein